jgi:hypothetical protein
MNCNCHSPCTASQEPCSVSCGKLPLTQVTVDRARFGQHTVTRGRTSNRSHTSATFEAVHAAVSTTNPSAGPTQIWHSRPRQRPRQLGNTPDNALCRHFLAIVMIVGSGQAPSSHVPAAACMLVPLCKVATAVPVPGIMKWRPISSIVLDYLRVDSCNARVLARACTG